MELCEEGELVLFPDNTHWVNHEAAEEVCAHLIRFLQAPLQSLASVPGEKV
jgi:hypothetical protein